MNKPHTHSEAEEFDNEESLVSPDNNITIIYSQTGLRECRLSASSVEQWQIF